MADMFGTPISASCSCIPPHQLQLQCDACHFSGDSISIGYTPFLKEQLSAVCQVQHSPWDVRDGGACDTAYGLQCLRSFLTSPSGAPLHPDLIVFNFGMHDGCVLLPPFRLSTGTGMDACGAEGCRGHMGSLVGTQPKKYQGIFMCIKKQVQHHLMDDEVRQKRLLEHSHTDNRMHHEEHFA